FFGDVRTTFEFHDVTFVRYQPRFHVETIARYDRAFESHVVHATEVVDGTIRGLTIFGFQYEDAGQLRQCFDHQHAGHHRVARKVSVEERLVHGKVLVTLDRFARRHGHHPVDHQKRVT